MRALVLACLIAMAIAPAAEAQTRQRRDVPLIVLKKRSFLDAGAQVGDGRYTNYVRAASGPSGVYPAGHPGARTRWLVEP